MWPLKSACGDIKQPCAWLLVSKQPCQRQGTSPGLRAGENLFWSWEGWYRTADQRSNAWHAALLLPEDANALCVCRSWTERTWRGWWSGWRRLWSAWRRCAKAPACVGMAPPRVRRRGPSTRQALRGCCRGCPCAGEASLAGDSNRSPAALARWLRGELPAGAALPLPALTAHRGARCPPRGAWRWCPHSASFPAGVAQYVQAFDALLAGPVAEYMKISKEVGGDVQKHVRNRFLLPPSRTAACPPGLFRAGFAVSVCVPLALCCRMLMRKDSDVNNPQGFGTDAQVTSSRLPPVHAVNRLPLRSLGVGHPALSLQTLARARGRPVRCPATAAAFPLALPEERCLQDVLLSDWNTDQTCLRYQKSGGQKDDLA